MVLGLVHHVQVGVNPASLLIGLLLVSAALLLVLVARRRQLDRERQTLLAAALGVDAHQLSGVGSAQAEVILSRVSAVTSRLRLLEGRASFDELTGVLRRGPGIAALERDIARARRSPDQRLTVAFIDVDGLKRVNDSDGHAAGDRLLQGVAAALQTRLRGEDLVFRYGGDEFVCVLPHSDVEAAAVTLQQVRGTLAHQAGDAGFSVGLASLRDGDDAHSLIARADADLYTGRRRRTT
jgi:diguanylate cyclase (GGDEF)-like protein